jgi:hypothetical protein
MAIVSLRHPIPSRFYFAPTRQRITGAVPGNSEPYLFRRSLPEREMDTVCAARKHPAYDEQHQHIAGVAAQLLEYSPVEIYANAHLFQKVTKAPALAGSKACQIGSQK